MTPNKKKLPDIRKYPKIDIDGTYSDHRESDSNCKESDLKYERSDTTILDESE